MKFISFFTFFVCLVALSNAAPIPSPGNDGNAGGSDPKGKGKARQESTPSPPPGSESSWSPSRAHTPTPAEDPNVPLPGRSGVHHDPSTGITTLHYGDDHMPEHMGHLQRNHELHRGNCRPMPLASDAEHTRNRNEALHNVPSGGKYRNTDENANRDEKHLAMLSNPHHSTTTTVEKLPASESSK
jgi:hypothetical protein